VKAIRYSQYGTLKELRLEDVALPDPARDQVRVQVRAASYNPMDGKIRRGEMKALSGFRFPRGLGHDFAGVVDAVGQDVERLKVGDEVFGVTPIREAGAFAEYVVVAEKGLGRKPPAVSFERAAAMTIVGITAWTGLVERAKLAAGQRVFVTGCLGGVGRSAVQIARRRGARIVGSCNASGREDALRLGVDEVVDYRAFDIASQRRRIDVVFDTAGSLSLRQCGTMLKKGGVSLHIVPTMAKVIACSLSRRHHLVFGNPTPQSLAAIADAATRGILVPEIGRTVSLADAIPAIGEREEAMSARGKLVIVPA
jgi:NADPH:quinone reductase-like Zn-dependent oxidoreductase